MPNSDATVLCSFTCDVCGKVHEDLSAPFSINPVFGNFYTKLRKMGWIVLEYKGEYTKYICPSCADKISSWFYDNNQKEVSEIRIVEENKEETGLDVLIERIERLNFHRNLDAISTEDLTDSEEWKCLMKFILETNGKSHKAKMQMFRCPDCGYKIGFEEFMTEPKEED